MIFTRGFISREEKIPWSFAEEVYMLPKGLTAASVKTSRRDQPCGEFIASLGEVLLKDWKGPTLFLVKISPIPLMLKVFWRLPTDVGNDNFQHIIKSGS